MFSRYHNRPGKVDRPKVNYHSQLPPGIGRENVDHVPIAQYVVCPEELESLAILRLFNLCTVIFSGLTAYSPSMLLMTNMLRQQIQMTTSFMETQKRLYESLSSSLQASYQYSSLKEIKEVISCLIYHFLWTLPQCLIAVPINNIFSYNLGLLLLIIPIYWILMIFYLK